MSRASLHLDNTVYEGWKSVRVGRSLKQISGSFELSLTDRWAHTGAHPNAKSPLLPGLSCGVSLGGQAVLAGYIDSPNPGYSDKDRSLTVSGRYKTADLVDCSAITPAGEFPQFKDQSLVQIAEALCAPFGIGVVNQVADAELPFARWKVEPGETVFTCLERAARQRQCLLTCTLDGDLLITRAGTEILPVTLVLGDTLKAGEGQFDERDRFSEYHVIGDSSAGGADWAQKDGEQAAQPGNVVKDGTMRRYRPLVILNEDNLDDDQAQARASWELRRRRARAQAVTVTVADWFYAPGKLWDVNYRLRITDPWLGVDDTRLITACDYAQDKDGTRTALTLMPPAGFEAAPYVATTQETAW